MSYVSAVPAKVTAAATDLAKIGSTINTANSAAATPTTAALAAAGDQVSAAIAAVFGEHAQGYQAVSAQLAAFHEQFVQATEGWCAGIRQHRSQQRCNDAGAVVIRAAACTSAQAGTVLLRVSRWPVVV